ncbi:MAG: BrnA antitoxin family protein [Bacteroidales bacterium]|nr:BrnA antitoxin family protein [Bacteroidales bacterium]
MNKNYSSKDSETNWNRLESMQDKDIDLSDIPEIKQQQLHKAKLRFAGKPVQKGKVRVNILLDASIVAYFKAQAGGRGYQTLINEALKENISYDDLEYKLRKIIREELENIH